MAEGDNESKSFEPAEAEHKAVKILGPKKSDTMGKAKAGIIPDPKASPKVKSKDPKHAKPLPGKSKTVRKAPIRKKKSKTVVRINSEPMTIEKMAYSEPPTIPDYIQVDKYEWKRYLFYEPLKSAMKREKGKSPKDPSILPSVSAKAPSRVLPIRSPSLELAVDIREHQNRNQLC